MAVKGEGDTFKQTKREKKGRHLSNNNKRGSTPGVLPVQEEKGGKKR